MLNNTITKLVILSIAVSAFTGCTSGYSQYVARNVCYEVFDEYRSQNYCARTAAEVILNLPKQDQGGLQ